MSTKLKYSEIYILDIGAYSGGGEALHQLGCDLIDLGYIVHIVQIDSQKCIPPRKFDQYYQHGLDKVLLNSVIDTQENLLIVPESATDFLFRYKKISKVIWWLSFNFYDGQFFWNSAEKFPQVILRDNRVRIQHIQRVVRNLFAYHHYRYPLELAKNLSGSYYAEEQLKNLNIQSTRLFHSIGIDFLNAGTSFDSSAPRKNWVLYNPRKKSALMRQLLKRNSFEYIPIQGYSPSGMISLFRSSKVYIDFGLFPGPERLPKETVFNGVNILVGRRNAACTDDVLIPDSYKCDIDLPLSEIELTIGNMLNNYESQLHDFDAFRTAILDMTEKYKQQINEIFVQS